MKSNKETLIKMLVTIGCVLVIVASLNKLLGGNSMTLSEYAEQYPELAYKETEVNETEATQQEASDGKNASAKDDTASSSTVSNSSDVTEITASTEIASTEVTQSTLLGASLNGTDCLEKRFTYTDSFYYEPLSDNLRRFITGISYPDVNHKADSATPTDTITEKNATELAITYDDLRYVHILHYNFNGEPVEGELICNEAIAQDMVEIFYELYRNGYRIEKVKLIDEYDGDDTTSMEDNNTSCFNYRVVENTTSLSKHALGLAIDINPLYNPYITYNNDGTSNVAPVVAMDYADRDKDFPYKIDENDLCYKLFTEHGFTWGGNWNSCKDYQHFQKVVE